MIFRCLSCGLPTENRLVCDVCHERADMARKLMPATEQLIREMAGATLDTPEGLEVTSDDTK